MNAKRGKQSDGGASVGSVITALNHPIRRTILRRFLDGPPTSPVGLAREMDGSLNLIAYHVKILAQNGVVRQVKTEQRRGALEHFFEPSLGSHAEWVEEILALPDND
jgi:predicted transcriptional regulator